MEQNNFDLKTVKVYRTTEGTIFEIAFVVIAIVVWGLIIWMIHQAPDIVATHFDASGKPNAYGPPAGIAIPCVIITIVAIGLMTTAYFPRLINMPTKLTNIRQVKLAIRGVRIAAIILLIMCLAIVYTLLGMESPNATPIMAMVVLLIIETIIFSIVISKTK